MSPQTVTSWQVFVRMIELTGHLFCATQAQAEIVRIHLPRHVELTRAETGCVRFEVTPTSDPLVWQVHEVFSTRVAFEAHQRRVRDSEWGQVTAGIDRDYVMTETNTEPGQHG